MSAGFVLRLRDAMPRPRTWPGRGMARVRAEPVTVGVLAALVLAGGGLRLWFMLVYRPALIGFPDSATYVSDAQFNLFFDKFRTVGYGEFLRLMHGIDPNLSFTPLAQHFLGIATALILYAAVRRFGGPAWIALIPAAVVLLDGGQIFLEHAILSESLFTFLVVCSLYCAARAIDPPGYPWAIAAGVFAGLGGTVRVLGFVLIPVIVVWFLAVGGLRWRPRLLRGGATLLTGAALAFGYLVAAHSQTGWWSFARTGPYTLYARVMTFADCSKFSPPKGTSFLCDARKPADRPGPNFYMFDLASPAVAGVGQPDIGNPSKHGVSEIARFSRAAIVGQPFAYIGAVAKDLWRYVAPGHLRHGSTGSTPVGLLDYFFNPESVHANSFRFFGYYTTKDFFVRWGGVNALRAYYRATVVKGPFMLLLVVLAALAPFLTRARTRAGALLFTLVAFALMLMPPATLFYDHRYAVPPLGPLAAAAAFGAWALWMRVRILGARRASARRPAPTWQASAPSS